MRCDEVVRRADRRVLCVVWRVESVCCAFTVDTPPKVRAIARPIAQLLENPIRIFLLPLCRPPRSSPRGRPCGRSTGTDSVVSSLRTWGRWGSSPGTPRHRGEAPCDLLRNCGRTKSSEWTANAGRAPSDDHRRGTAGLWHPACRRAYEFPAAQARSAAELGLPGLCDVALG